MKKNKIWLKKEVKVLTFYPRSTKSVVLKGEQKHKLNKGIFFKTAASVVGATAMTALVSIAVDQRSETNQTYETGFEKKTDLIKQVSKFYDFAAPAAQSANIIETTSEFQAHSNYPEVSNWNIDWTGDLSALQPSAADLAKYVKLTFQEAQSWDITSISDFKYKGFDSASGKEEYTIKVEIQSKTGGQHREIIHSLYFNQTLKDAIIDPITSAIVNHYGNEIVTPKITLEKNFLTKNNAEKLVYLETQFDQAIQNEADKLGLNDAQKTVYKQVFGIKTNNLSVDEIYFSNFSPFNQISELNHGKLYYWSLLFNVNNTSGKSKAFSLFLEEIGKKGGLSTLKSNASFKDSLIFEVTFSDDVKSSFDSIQNLHNFIGNPINIRGVNKNVHGNDSWWTINDLINDYENVDWRLYNNNSIGAFASEAKYFNFQKTLDPLEPEFYTKYSVNTSTNSQNELVVSIAQRITLNANAENFVELFPPVTFKISEQKIKDFTHQYFMQFINYNGNQNVENSLKEKFFELYQKQLQLNGGTIYVDDFFELSNSLSISDNKPFYDDLISNSQISIPSLPDFTYDPVAKKMKQLITVQVQFTDNNANPEYGFNTYSDSKDFFIYWTINEYLASTSLNDTETLDQLPLQSQSNLSEDTLNDALKLYLQKILPPSIIATLDFDQIESSNLLALIDDWSYQNDQASLTLKANQDFQIGNFNIKLPKNIKLSFANSDYQNFLAGLNNYHLTASDSFKNKFFQGSDSLSLGQSQNLSDLTAIASIPNGYQAENLHYSAFVNGNDIIGHLEADIFKIDNGVKNSQHFQSTDFTFTNGQQALDNSKKLQNWVAHGYNNGQATNIPEYVVPQTGSAENYLAQQLNFLILNDWNITNLQYNFNADQTEVIVNANLTSVFDSSINGNVDFKFKLTNQVSINQYEESIQNFALSIDNTTKISLNDVFAQEKLTDLFKNFSQTIGSIDQNGKVIFSAQAPQFFSLINLNLDNIDNNLSYDSNSATLAMIKTGDSSFKFQLQIAVNGDLVNNKVWSKNITIESANIDLNNNFDYLDLQHQIWSKDVNSATVSGSANFGTLTDQEVNDLSNKDFNTIENFLENKFGFKFTLPSNINQSETSWTFSFDKNTKQHEVLFNFKSSSGSNEILKIYLNSNKSFSQILLENHLSSSNFRLKANSNFDTFMPLDNPFTTSNPNRTEPNQAIEALNSLVFDDYEIDNVDNWQIQGDPATSTLATATLHLKLKNNPAHSDLLTDLQAQEKVISGVVFQYQKSTTDWLDFLLTAYGDTSNEIDSLQALNENSAEQQWDQLNTSIVNANVNLQVRIDNTKPNNSFEKNFVVTYTASGITSDGTTISQVKTVNWSFQLKHNSEEYLNYVLQNAVLNLKLEQQAKNYLNWNLLGNWQNYLDVQNLDKELIITGATFSQPTTSDALKATISVEFSYALSNGVVPVDATKITKNYDVDVQNSIEKLLLNQFINTWNQGSTDKSIEIVNSSVDYPTKQSSVSDWIAYLDQFGILGNQKIALQQAIDNFNQIHQSNGNIDVQFDYQYPDLSSTDANLSLILTFGSETQNIVYSLNYPRSFNQHVAEDVVNVKGLKVSDAFADLSNLSTNDIFDRIQKGPSISDLTVGDLQDLNNVTFKTLKYIPPQHDHTLAHYQVEVTYKNDSTLHQKIDLEFNFSTSYNQILTDKLPASVNLETKGNFNHLVSEDLSNLNLNTSNPFANFFGANSDFLQTNINFSNVKLLKSPDFVNEVFAYQFSANVSIGSAGSRSVILNANLDETSQYFANLMQSQIIIKPTEALLQNLDVNLRSQDQTYNLNDPDFKQYFVFSSTKQESLFKKYFTVNSDFILRRLPSNAKITNLDFNLFLTNGNLDLGNKSIQVQYEETLDEISLRNIPSEITSFAIAQGTQGVKDNSYTPSANEIIEIRDFLTQNGVEKQGLSDVKFKQGSFGNPIIDQTSDHYYLTQSAVFTVFYGQASKDIILHFFVNPSSDDYIESILQSDFFTFEISQSFRDNDNWNTQISNNDIRVYLNGQNVAINSILNYGTPNSSASYHPQIEVSLTGLPSQDSSDAVTTITVNQSVQKEVNFQFVKTPNQKAIEEAFTGKNSAILQGQDFGANQLPNNITLGKKNFNNTEPIFESVPDNSTLGFDNQNELNDLGKLSEWLENNTDLNFHNFAVDLVNNSNVLIDPVQLADVEYNHDEKSADQIFKLIFKSGQTEKIINLQLHFSKSPYQIQREQGIQNWNQDIVFQPAYLDTTDFHVPDINDATDFKINDLLNNNYSLKAIKNYHPPLEDSNQGSITLVIVDNDANSNHTPQELDLLINFNNSPNQVKTNQLANQHNSVATALLFSFDNFTVNPNTQSPFLQNVAWPSQFGTPTILQVSSESSSSFEEIFKVSIAFGNSQFRDLYLKGSLNHYTKTYLESASVDSKLKLDSNILNSTTIYKTGDLTLQEFLNSSFIFKTLPSDINNQQIKKSKNIQNQLRVDDILVKKITITSIDSQTKSGKAEVILSITDPQTQQEITYSKNYDIFFTYDQKIVQLNAFSQNVVQNQLLTLNTGSNIDAPPLFNSNIANWLTQNTDLPSFETIWNLPTTASISTAKFSIDPKAQTQDVFVTYTNGVDSNNQPITSPDFAFRIKFDKSPNQAKLDNFDQNTLIHLSDNYLQQIFYNAPQQADSQNFVLDANYQISSDTDAITNYVAPGDDNVNGTVQVRVVDKNDANASRDIAISFNFSHSANYYRSERLKSFTNFELNPYLTNVPLSSEIQQSNVVFDNSQISDIQEISTIDPDATHAYTAKVTFGQEQDITINLYRPQNPLKQMLKKAIENYTFDVSDSIKNKPEYLANSSFDFSSYFNDFVLTDSNGNLLANWPPHITTDSYKYIYTAPKDDDSTQAHIDFDLVYTGEVATWTKTTNGTTRTLIGSTDVNSPGYLGDQGFVKVANSEKIESVVEHKTIDFNYKHSNNFYYLEDYTQNFSVDYGAQGTSGFSQSILGFPPSSLGNSLTDQLNWLTQNSNFQIPNGQSQISISSLSYTQNVSSNVADIHFQFQKGTTKFPFTIKLHFATTYNQDQLDSKSISDLVNRIDANYLKVGHEQIDNLTAQSFEINDPYEIFNNVSNGVHSFIGVSDHDGYSASVKLWIRNQNDHNTIREITVPLTFAQSINQAKLSQIDQHHQYQLDPFWQSENNPLPTDSTALKTFVLQKLAEDSQIKAQLQDQEVIISNLQILNDDDAKLLNTNVNKAWSVSINIGQSGPITIYLWQQTNPLKNNFDQIMKNLDWDIDSSITDIWNHDYIVPTLQEVTFSKNNQLFALPNDIDAATGLMSFQIKSVDLPQNDDATLAVVHFDATFQLKDANGIIHDYVQKNLSTTFDYLYSRNGMKIQTAFHSLGIITNNHINLGTNQNPLGNVAPETISIQNFISLVNQNFTDTLQQLNISESALSLTYGSNQTRNNSEADQRGILNITLGQTSYDLQLTLNFYKSYNQDLLDQKTLDDLFGSFPNRGIDSSYVQVTKLNAPVVTNFNLQEARYQVTDVDFNSYVAPDINNGKRNAQVSVTIQDTLDLNVKKDVILTFYFDTVGLDVSQFSKATGKYSSIGKISLPGGSIYNFNNQDPAINGFSTIDVTNFYDQNDSPLNLPPQTKLEYQVVDQQTNTIVQNWSEQRPVNLLKGQIVQLRIVSDNPNYTIQNSKVITLNSINNLITGIAIPTDFAWTDVTYHGNEGQGTIDAAAMSNYLINLHTQQEAYENQNLHYVFTVTRKNVIVHDHQLASAVVDLEVGDRITLNVVVNDTSTHFLLNPQAEHPLPDVTNLKIAPDVSINDLELSTSQSDGERGHDGFANANLKISNSATSQAQQRGPFPLSKDHWEWSYEVWDAQNQVITPASNNLPTNLKNGQIVVVSYQARAGYDLPDAYRKLSKQFEVKNLVYEITLPNDIAINLPIYVGSENQGTINSFSNSQSQFSSANNFAYQEHIVVQYRVEDANGNLKINWSTFDQIKNLSVHDKVYARYVVDDVDNYILMNPLNSDKGIFVNTVTNLEITPRINPSDLTASSKGVRFHATIDLYDESNNHAIAQPTQQDHWHWEYQIIDASGSIISAWSASVPIALDNGHTVKVRVVADEDYLLDANYSVFSFQIKKLKLEINISTLRTPNLDFQGFLEEGSIKSMLNNKGQNYQIPPSTFWEYYVETVNTPAKELQTNLNDPSKWTDWDGVNLSTGPQNLNVGDFIHFRLKVADENVYVLSDSFEPPAIMVKELEINPSNIRAHYYPETFENEGSIRIDYRDPSVQYSAKNPFVNNLEETVIRWEIRVVKKDGTVNDWQNIKNISNLSNGDHVYLRSLPINSNYLMSQPINIDFVVSHLLIKIDASQLTLRDFAKFYDSKDEAKVNVDNIGNLINGEAGLATPKVLENQQDVTQKLPNHVTLKYKYISVKQSNVSFKDPQIAILNNPPEHGLENGDRIMIFLSTDNPDVYKLSQNVAHIVTVKGLSPLPPSDLQPQFEYNNSLEKPGIDGKGYGSTIPSSQIIENFFWEYLVVSADVDIPESLDNINQLSEWTANPPSALSNGDRVFYRLVPENPLNLIKSGTHIDSVSQKEIRNDYLSEPTIINGLKRLVNVDTEKLANLELTFAGNDGKGFIAGIQDANSAIAKLLKQNNSEYFQYVIYVNGTIFDPNQATLKNDDQIAIKIIPSNINVVFSESDNKKLIKEFTVSDLPKEAENKNQVLRTMIIIAMSVTIIPIAGLYFLKLYRKNRRKRI